MMTIYSEKMFVFPTTWSSETGLFESIEPEKKILRQTSYVEASKLVNLYSKLRNSRVDDIPEGSKVYFFKDFSFSRDHFRSWAKDHKVGLTYNIEKADIVVIDFNFLKETLNSTRDMYISPEEILHDGGYVKVEGVDKNTTRYKLLNNYHQKLKKQKTEFESLIENIDKVKAFLPADMLNKICAVRKWDFELYTELESFMENDKEEYAVRILNVTDYKHNLMFNVFCDIYGGKIYEKLKQLNKVHYKPLKEYVSNLYCHGNYQLHRTENVFNSLKENTLDNILCKKHYIMKCLKKHIPEGIVDIILGEEVKLFKPEKKSSIFEFKFEEENDKIVNDIKDTEPSHTG